MLCHVFWSQVEYKIVCFIYYYKGYHNFVVIVLMIVKFGTDMKLDVFYTVMAKSS